MTDRSAPDKDWACCTECGGLYRCFCGSVESFTISPERVSQLREYVEVMVGREEYWATIPTGELAELIGLAEARR